MDIHQLKLELINQISQCNDPAVLQAIANVLALQNRVDDKKVSSTAPLPFNPVSESNHALCQKHSPGDAEAKELQQDMDDAFGES